MYTLSSAEPFLLPGQADRPACLLIHGFTGTPKEMRWMGEYLNRQGYSCLGVRLAGHATRPEDMIRSRWTDWTTSVEDGYNLLRGVSPNIFLIGLSMGGILSLLMSTRLEVRGVIAMSTPYELPVKHPAWLIRLYSYFKVYMPKSGEAPDADWFDKEAFREHISYPLNPIRAGAELQTMLGVMRAALPQVNAPVLLMHSKDDVYVLPENMPRIHERIGARDKEMLWLAGSGHVLTRDAAREQVFAAVAAFIKRIGNQFV